MNREARTSKKTGWPPFFVSETNHAQRRGRIEKVETKSSSSGTPTRSYYYASGSVGSHKAGLE